MLLIFSLPITAQLQKYCDYNTKIFFDWNDNELAGKKMAQERRPKVVIEFNL